jgi:HTH-type transcriptional regulator / antitoxin HigA
MIKTMDAPVLKKMWPSVENFLSIQVLGIVIENCEAEHHDLSGASGLYALKYLMKEHDLRQEDLSEIGSQGVVSEILNGKRQLNVGQVQKLSERFKVSPAVFI